MKARLPLLLSLILNLLLMDAILVGRQRLAPAAPVSQVIVMTNAVSRGARTERTSVKYSSRRAPWTEISSTNLATYISNLRRIACPELTIRVIIASEMEARFEQKFKAQTVSSNFWMTGAQEEAEHNRRIQLRMALNREKEAVFEQLLGADWWTVEGLTQPFADVLPGMWFSGFLAEDKALLAQLAFQRCDRLQKELDNRASRLITVEEAERRIAITDQLGGELQTFLTPAEFEELELRCATATLFDVWSLEDQFGCRFTGPELREYLRITRARRPLGSWWTERFDQPPAISEEAQVAEVAQIRQLLGETRFQLYLEAQRTGPRHRSEK